MVYIRDAGFDGSTSTDTGGSDFQGGGSIEFVGDEWTSMQLGSVRVPGIYDYEEAGGQNAPSEATEKGFEFTSHVNEEPITATFNAWVTPGTLQELRTLRQRGEPFAVYVKSTRLGQCKLNNLSASQEGAASGALDVEIEVQEIQQATIGTTELKVTTATGTKTSGSEGGAGGPGGDLTTAAEGGAEKTSDSEQWNSNFQEQLSGPDYGNESSG